MSLTPTPAQILEKDRLQFPGMLPREILIYREWLKTHEGDYDTFAYDELLGAGYDPGPQWEVDQESALRAVGVTDEAYLKKYAHNMRKMAIQNSQKRADAILHKGPQATLVEVKDRAGAS